jgi:3-deoxy-D-manno-octulosonic-acid transferase
MRSPGAAVADPLSDTVLGLYRAAGRAAAPFLHLLVAARGAVGKEDIRRRSERYGHSDLARPHGPLVWVHAASVGETQAVLPIVDALAARGLRVLMTTGTVTSAAVAARRLPARALHQFAPLDVPRYVARFLDHWQPDLAVFVESEVWPTTVLELERRAVPQIVVNARLSARSTRRWMKVRGLARALFGRLSLVLAQTELDGERLRALGAAPVIVTGNLKFDVAPLAADEDDLAEVRRQIAGRPVWLAASTHPGEEEIVAAVHRRLAASRPDLLTILVPRHPERGAALQELFGRAGFRSARRSAGQPVEAGTAILLADTIGELGVFYRVASVALIGGSLVEAGGHNPIEAACLGAAILYGPHVASFAEIYRSFSQSGTALGVAGEADLSAAVERFLADPAGTAEICAKAKRIVERSRGALDRTLAETQPYWGPLAARDDAAG